MAKKRKTTKKRHSTKTTAATKKKYKRYGGKAPTSARPDSPARKELLKKAKERGFTNAHAQITEQMAIDACKGTRGIILNLAYNLGCCWLTAKQCLKRWPRVREAFEAEVECMGDAAEKVVQQWIEDKSLNAAKFALTTKYKNRGYTTGQQVQVSGEMTQTLREEMSQEIRIEDLDLPPAVMRLVLGAVEKRKAEITENADQDQ